MEILKHKNTIYEIKCSLYTFNSAMDMREMSGILETCQQKSPNLRNIKGNIRKN